MGISLPSRLPFGGTSEQRRVRIASSAGDFAQGGREPATQQILRIRPQRTQRRLRAQRSFCLRPATLDDSRCAAIHGAAKLLVTGDEEILGLTQVGALEIVTPRQYWERQRTAKN